MTKTELRIIAALREGRQKWADAAMEFPKPESFDHGVQVGVHRGLGMALEAIEAILDDEELDEERR